MENEGGAGDDQGSGWLEVKRRHRTSSKLSIQNVSGGPSSKIHSASACQQVSTNEDIGSLRGRQQSLPYKAGPEVVTHAKDSGDGPGSVSIEAGKAADFLDKRFVNLEIEHLEKASDLEGGTKAVQESPIKENLDPVPKIKWGDLEDLTLAPKIKCGVNNLLEHENSLISGEQATLEQKKLVTPEGVEQFPDRIFSSDTGEESLEGNWTEASVILSEDVGLCNASGKISCPNDTAEDTGKTLDEAAGPSQHHAGGGLASSNEAIENHHPLPVEGVGTMNPQGPEDRSEDSFLNISEVSIIHENTSMCVGLQDAAHQEGGPENSVDASVRADDGRELEDGSANVSELGEDESGEGKERFRQRLWCFLFENLNRAVDELYLLCELECDTEQMKEAILVLEESASDFRELKSRVEDFESTKRSSSQSTKDGMAMNVKTDHRRPHALSWEVRRMTTSPHRAEILSSSLEAFKKIQQERAGKFGTHGVEVLGLSHRTPQHVSHESRKNLHVRNNELPNVKEPIMKSRIGQRHTNCEKQNVETSRLSKAHPIQNGRLPPQSLSASDTNVSRVSLKDATAAGKCKREPLEPISEIERQVPKKDKVLAESRAEKNSKSVDTFRRHNSLSDKEKEKEKEKRNSDPWKSMDAWKEKRNWEDILKSPLRSSSRVSHSPSMSRKSSERARILHDKLMSPEKKKKTALDMKREAEEKHARAMRIRSQLENERVQRLQRTSEKLNRVNEWQAVRSMKLREGMYARHQRSESRHEAYLAQVARRAGDESSKVNEVRFITSLNEENKKLTLRQKLHDSELRRAEKLQTIRTKQKEDTAREEAVLERRKLLEAEKLQRLAETQRKKEEAQVRREEERKASSAAREARAIEQLRRKEVRAKAQQEEAELLAQKLAERLSESEQRRKFYLEQIREKASMDFRDQSSPLMRRSMSKEGRSVSTNSLEDYQTTCILGAGGSALGLDNVTLQHSLKRRIKKIRQRLMALKYEFTEPPVGAENTGVGYRAVVGAARAKIGRWIQDLQRLRQARKEGAASIGLIVGDMIKFLEGKDPELHASRQAGLLDFIASALPASHTSRPEACQVTIYLLQLLRVVLSVPANRSYFLSQNLLPPIIPMLSASLENYIKIAASSNLPGSTNILSNKTSVENLESIAEVLEGFLWTVTTIIGHVHFDERQLQMQDGLMELVVAYQVIHRLRDFFALYDRPQIEGSPFPSSILLSLNLLAVLTSRPGTICSIDWVSFVSTKKLADSTQESTLSKHPQSLDLGDPFVINSASGDSNYPSISKHVTDVSLNDSGQIHGEEKKSLVNGVYLSNILEDRPLDGDCKKELSFDVSLEMDNVRVFSQISSTTSSGESQKILLDGHAKPPLPLKNENSATSDDAELNRVDEPMAHTNNDRGKEVSLKQPVAFLTAAIAETSLVSLPSLLTAVLLQANNRLSSEQSSYVLPSNFEEVATGVLKVLNNLALLNITLLQSMLARSDLKMEFFHLMSFLLSHCTSKWKSAHDQVGLLLLESLLLLGYFALFHHGNQAVLRWGKSPTILHKVCDLPFVFFSDPELTPILAGTLVATCYGCEQNRGVVQQELSMDMLLSLLKSCRQELLPIQPDSLALDNGTKDDPCDGNQMILDARKPQGDFPVRSNRRSAKILLGKGGTSGSIRVSKTKIQRDGKGTKTCDEWALKHNLPASGASSTFMLHRRFPNTFIDKAEEFFSFGIPSATM